VGEYFVIMCAEPAAGPERSIGVAAVMRRFFEDVLIVPPLPARLLDLDDADACELISLSTSSATVRAAAFAVPEIVGPARMKICGRERLVVHDEQRAVGARRCVLAARVMPK
jgi:hypothetical protein